VTFWKREETFESTAPAPTRVVGVPPFDELVPLGWQDHTTTEVHHRTGATTVRTAEYQLYTHRRGIGGTGRMFIQWGRNGSIEPLQPHSGNEDKRTPLGTVPRRGVPSGRYPTPPNDSTTPLEEFAG
jgi:hypothetical protein